VTIGFHPDALAEIERARDWYDERRRGLGGELVDEVERRLTRMEIAPKLFPVVAKRRLVRRALLKRFPYALVFTVMEDDYILIVAFAHARRRARYWRARVGRSG